MSGNELVAAVKMFLSSHHMLAYDTWISGCVQYFINESQTTTDVKNNAYQQWLLNDLKYICPGSLPENLAELNKTELMGKYVLQINSVIDISTPKYQQYLKMKKTDTQNIEATLNAEEKISSKRMLKFELTDGKQTVFGMEYETMKLKNEDIIPGCKVLIEGPVTCRLGMMFLTDKTMELLGGEVQNILETHSLAAQLASFLNLPLIAKSLTEITQVNQSHGGIVSGNTSTTTHNRSYLNDDVRRQIPQAVQGTSLSSTRNNNYNGNVSNSVPESSFGKRQLNAEPAPEKRMKYDEELDTYEQEWENFNEDIRVIEEIEKLHSTIEHDEEEYKFEEEDLRNIEEFEQLHSNSQTILSKEPFVYIKQINDLGTEEKNGKVFKIKAQIQNVLTKLTITKKREFNLKCTIIDGTGCMDVEFSSDILSSFFGYTPDSIREITKNVDTNPGIKNEINQAFVKTSETLRTLYCIMELTMFTLPKITRVIYYEDAHIDLLKKRLQSMSLNIS